MTNDGHNPDFHRIAFIDLEASCLGSAPAFPSKSAGQDGQALWNSKRASMPKFAISRRPDGQDEEVRTPATAQIGTFGLHPLSDFQ